MNKQIKVLSLAVLASAMVACGGSGETETSKSSEESAKMEQEAPEGTTGTYVVNEKESMVMWEGNMLKIGGVSLYGHNGTINLQPSKIAIENGSFKQGGVVIDMTSITPTDENYTPEEGKGKKELVGHLSSPDFFDVKNHPTAKFEVLGLKEGNLIGKLTIRGVTHEEAIENVSIEYKGNQMMAEGKMTIDRQKYNVAFEMPAEDKILSDDIDLQFKIVADMVS